MKRIFASALVLTLIFGNAAFAEQNVPKHVNETSDLYVNQSFARASDSNAILPDQETDSGDNWEDTELATNSDALFVGEVKMPDGEITVGTTKKIEISFLDFETEPSGVWRTSDNKLAEVDSNGMLTAKERGVVKVSFTLEDGYTQMCSYVIHSEMTPPPAGMYTSREWEVFKITNRNRMKEGHLPLSMNPLMQKGADIRKKELTIKYDANHKRPDGRSFFTVFGDIGFKMFGAGENIAWGFKSPSVAVDFWMNSEGHYKNIMKDSYLHFAAGEKSNYWVQLFSGCESGDLNHMKLFLPNSLTFKKNTSIDNFGIIAAFNCTDHGISYMPLLSAMCTGYNPTLEGEQKITVRYEELEAEFTVIVKGSASSSGGGGGGGGSSSGGGGGGGSSSVGGGKGPASGSAGTSASAPAYVVKGSWNQTSDGNWKFADTNGLPYINKWAAVENPYANLTLGQSAFDWFYFDSNANMVTGWYSDSDGNQFYMNPNQDGTRGKMVTGWMWIPDQNGVQRCHYFNPNSDGTRGKMIKNSVADGNIINENGEWVVSGVVQIK